jgi:hypothetical protein
VREFAIFVLSVSSGAAGYLIATFWVRPILRYLDVKDSVHSHLVFYANAIMVAEDAVVVPEMKHSRTKSNRRDAAALAACAMRLPRFYTQVLRLRHEDPVAASGDLIGLSNACDRKSADGHLANLKRHLNIPSALGE